MSESKFKKGDFVRKTRGSWWEGRVVGFYGTAENPDGVAVQLDKPNGPVQIYPAAAMELMPSPSDHVRVTDSFGNDLIERELVSIVLRMSRHLQAVDTPAAKKLNAGALDYLQRKGLMPSPLRVEETVVQSATSEGGE
jgi:hypothetical protein